MCSLLSGPGVGAGVGLGGVGDEEPLHSQVFVVWDAHFIGATSLQG